MFWHYCGADVLFQYEDVHSCFNSMDATTRLLDSGCGLLDETIDHLRQQLVLAGYCWIVHYFTRQSYFTKRSEYYLQQMVWRQRTWHCNSTWGIIDTYWICHSLYPDRDRICRH